MPLILEGIYKAIVKKIEDGKIYVDIPDLKQKDIPITEGLFSFSFSKTGYYPQLPKQNDIVYVFFEDKEPLKPILIFFGNDEIKNLKEDETKFAVKKFKIVDDASKNEDKNYVLVDFENEKITIAMDNCIITLSNPDKKITVLAGGSGEIILSTSSENAPASIVTNKTYPVCPYTGLPIKGHARIRTDVNGVA